MMVAYSFKRRFVEPIQAGLGILPVMGPGLPCEFVLDEGSNQPRPFDPARDLDPPIYPKRHTIRDERRGCARHARPGEEVQLYHGMRTKRCFLIGRGTCVSAWPISLDFLRSRIDIVSSEPRKLITGTDLDEFAHSDGFGDFADMRNFWREEHEGVDRFVGVLITWRA